MGVSYSKLTKPELEKIIKNANFTDEEEAIFKMLCSGRTIADISLKISICETTVNRRIKSIKEKVKRLEVMQYGDFNSGRSRN